MSTIGESLETKVAEQLSRPEGERPWEELGIDAKGYRVSFGDGDNVLKLIVVMVAQL